MPRKRNISEGANRAVIYARYSSHNQKDASIEQQVDACRRFAEQNGLTIIEEYADRAVSGKTDNRPNFQRMMRDAAKGVFSYVIAWKSNRMGRNMLQAMVNEARLSDVGVKCLYTEEDFDDTAAGRFALRNMMNVNQFYSENMAEDITRGMLDGARKGLVMTVIPYGYCKGPDNRYAVKEDEAEVVREIFHRYRAGESITAIAEDLNRRGIKTKRGREWNKHSFHALLSNERYTGVYLFSDVRIEGGMPVIVDKIEFEEVQRMMRRKNPQGGRRREENARYLLTGKLFCGHCGSPMIGLSGTGKAGTKHYYYVCRKRRIGADCRKKNVRRDWIERKVAEAVRTHIMREDVVEWLTVGYEKFIADEEKESPLSSAEKELAAVQRSIKNILNAIEQGVFTDTTKDRLLELEEQQRELKITIAVAKKSLTEVPRSRIKYIVENFRTGDLDSKEYQAQLIDNFVRAVYLYDDNIRIVFHFVKDQSAAEIPFEDVDSIFDMPPECSFMVPSGPPKRSSPKGTASFWAPRRASGAPPLY